MSYYLLLVLLKLYCLSVAEEAAHLTAYRKFIYQKDMSEYCRRNVIPSVFLGRQVVDANSKILHFSRLEVPYSCLINIRTESGSNMIVVIQVNSDWDKSCNEGDSQLIIHEMGETFGGYWEQIPDRLMKGGLYREDNSYTLTTTNLANPTTTMTSEGIDSTTKIPPLTLEKDVKKSEEETLKEEYLTVELPLLNVSAEIVPGLLAPELSFTNQNIFDFSSDVTSWQGIAYDTQMVPIVEFSLNEQNSNRRTSDNIDIDRAHFGPEIQVQLRDLFTPDPRLTIPSFHACNHRGKLHKYQPSVNKRLKFKKNKMFFTSNGISFTKKVSPIYGRSQLSLGATNPYLSKLYDVTQKTAPEIIHDEQIINSWDILSDIIKNLSSTKDVQTEPPHKELAIILRGIANRMFNKSVYLAPVLTTVITGPPALMINEQRAELSTKEDPVINHKRIEFSESSGTWKRLSTSTESIKTYAESSALNSNNTVIYNNETVVPLLPLAFEVDSIILNATNENRSTKEDKLSNKISEAIGTTKNDKLEPLTVSLVDHESWENIVKAAPVMAAKLNQTQITARAVEAHYLTKADYDSGQSKVRQKRCIHAIDTEVAKPKQVKVRKKLSTTSASIKFNMMEYQRYIELQEDEVYERVALRFSKSYIGPPLLNFCALNTTFTRHVHLFNSSRLVFAITNFTLKGMTVVVTPAHILMESEERCQPASLECQVSGARVCIDSLCACDGVPNCGSFDIYDEDRLQCGATAGISQNTCLAALSFLALLVTVVYTIHYWLKRCVPKVSSAFFIYTDAAENVLYLDTIMRSPHDVGVTKNFYREGLKDLEYADIHVKRNIWQRFVNWCRVFLRWNHKPPENEVHEIIIKSHECSGKISTFAKSELDNIAPPASFQPEMSEAAVQTNCCFELKEFATNYCKGPLEDSLESTQENNNIQASIDSLESINPDVNYNHNVLNEINILKFFKSRTASKTLSAQLSPNNTESIALSEFSSMQINKCKTANTNYYKIDQNDKAQQSNKIQTVNDEECSDELVLKKQLRFHEEVKVIPPIISDEELEENFEVTDINIQRSVIFGTNKVFHLQNLSNNINEGEKPSGSVGRELKSYFWGATKEKKKKKPKRK